MFVSGTRLSVGRPRSIETESFYFVQLSETCPSVAFCPAIEAEGQSQGDFPYFLDIG